MIYVFNCACAHLFARVIALIEIQIFCSLFPVFICVVERMHFANKYQAT